MNPGVSSIIWFNRSVNNTCIPGTAEKGDPFMEICFFLNNHFKKMNLYSSKGYNDIKCLKNNLD